MDSVLATIAFKEWFNSSSVKIEGENINLVEAVDDAYYKAEDIYKLLQEAFKAGMFWNKERR